MKYLNIYKIIIFCISLYKRFISPLLSPCCRFYPSCSDYMAESLDKHGIITGLVKGSLRILRCNPFSEGGYDPVIK